MEVSVTNEAMPAVTFDAVVEAIRTGVREVKGAGVDAREITAATSFWMAAEAGGPCLDFDSLDLVELLVFLEERYGWELSEEQIDADEWRTVGDLAALVVEHVRG
jgi:acyl carrier protein